MVNNYVSRETILFVMLHRRETVCCLPSYPTRKASFTGHLLVGQPHFGLCPVRLDRLRICPFQSRQRQQNISLSCTYKAGLSFAKIPNWDGQQRRLFYPSWTQFVARKTIKLMSSTTEGWAKIGQPTGIIVSMGKIQTNCTLLERRIGKDRTSRPCNLSHGTMEIYF